jgi:hypothetical protein
VRFLRTLTNSVVCGLYFSLLLAVLVSDLNINLALNLIVLVKLTLFLAATYGLLAVLFCLLITSFYRFFTGEKIAMGFVSPSFLAVGFSLWTLLFLVIFRENSVYFASFFGPSRQPILRMQMVSLFVLAIAGIVLPYRFRRRKPRPLVWIAYFAFLAVVLFFVIWGRLSFPLPQPAYKLATLETKKIEKRAFILDLEGLTMDFLLPLTQDHKLPNFSFLMERGCWGRLQSFTPSDPFVLNRSLNTGKLPSKHGQISEVRYGIPGLDTKLEVVPRFILFRQLKRTGLLKIFSKEPRPGPKDIWRIFEDYGASVLKWDRPLLALTAAKPSPKTEKLFAASYKDFQFDMSWAFGQVRHAFFRDAEAEEEAFIAKSEAQPDLFSMALDGLNTVEMYFYKYSFPEAFGDIRQEDIRKYGTVIEKYYQFYDQIVGKYMASLKEDELFIIYSPHGIEPLPFWKRLVEWALGNSAVSAYSEQAPDGVVFFYGRGIAGGKNIGSLRLVDIVPAILYSAGLPVGKDMDGIVRGSLFDPRFALENPVFYISSYEDVNISRAR